MAVKLPETLGHLHYWSVQMTRHASKDEVIEAFGSSSRIALIRISDGLEALNTVKELMADLGRPQTVLIQGESSQLKRDLLVRLAQLELSTRTR